MSNSQDWATNYIPINRKIFGHEFWEEKRVFSKFEAWMDLLQTARYEKEIKTDWINNKQVSYGRGQLPSSIRYLQKRWNWGSITKVERYLRLLENKDMVVLEKGQGQFVITICKYDTYNPLKKDERTVKGQGRGQEKDKSNKEIIKELLKSNTELPTATSELESNSLSSRAERFVEKFNNIKKDHTGTKGKFRRTDEVLSKFKNRIKTYKPEEIITAINNAFKHKWHKEKNYEFVTPSYILREDILERYLNISESQLTTTEEVSLFVAP